MAALCEMSVERLSASRGLISSDVSGRELCALRASKAQKSRKLVAHTWAQLGSYIVYYIYIYIHIYMYLYSPSNIAHLYRAHWRRLFELNRKWNWKCRHICKCIFALRDRQVYRFAAYHKGNIINLTTCFSNW